MKKSFNFNGLSCRWMQVAEPKRSVQPHTPWSASKPDTTFFAFTRKEAISKYPVHASGSIDNWYYDF